MRDLKAIQAAVHIMDKGVSYLGGNFNPLIGKVIYVPEKEIQLMTLPIQFQEKHIGKSRIGIAKKLVFG